MLLEGLEAVAWSRLMCTVGTAEHVPDLLRRLLSPSYKWRHAALWRLSMDFVHQDTVWTGAAAAVPFFIELLGAPSVGSKDEILVLLRDIMEGYYHSSTYDGRGQIVTVSEAPAEVSEPDGEDEPAEGTEDRSQPQRPAIRAGVPVYLALLRDDDPAVRIAAAKLLVRCRSAAFDPMPALTAARQHESHPVVLTALFLSLGKDCQTHEDRVAYYTRALYEHSLSDAERVATALELVTLAREAAPNAALELLVDCLARPSRALERVYQLVTRGAALNRRIGLALHNLPAAQLAPVVGVLKKTLPVIGRGRQEVSSALLLRAFFPKTEGKVVPASALSHEQREVLESLFAAEPFWREGDVFLSSFRDYGLPSTRPALADYLGLSLPPEDALGAVEQPRPHRPAPFTVKAYQAHLRRAQPYLYPRRKKRYRFEPGHDIDVYSPDGYRLCFFPKTPQAVRAMEREAALLSALPRLPLSRWYPGPGSADTRAAGRVFMSDFRVDGEPLTPDALARLRGTRRWGQFATLLARFLATLHTTPLDIIPVPLPPAEGRDTWERVYAEVRSRLFDHLLRDVRTAIATCFEAFLAEPGNWEWTPTIIHGDFAPHNVLYCPSETGEPGMSGIQGWSRAGLGDPASDLATLLGAGGYGEEFVLHFRDAYPSLDEELPRARFYVWVRPLRDALAAAPGHEGEAAQQVITHYMR